VKATLGIILVVLTAVPAALAGKCPPTPPPPPPVVIPTATAVPLPRCPPGLFPYGGKDGDESAPYHNQECCPDTNGNQICDDKERPTTTTVAQPRVVAPTIVPRRLRALQE
jgi:hypothetical protein